MTLANTASKDAAPARPPRLPIRAAVVVGVDEDDVLVAETESPSPVVRARAVDLGGRVLAAGDAVLVAETTDGRWILAAIGVGATRRALGDGSTVETEGDRVIIRGPDGLIRVKYEGGSAEVTAPSGDLTLAAPGGKVKLSAGSDVEIQAARKLELGVLGGATPAITVDALTTRLHAPAVEIEAKTHRVLAEESTVMARAITLTAERFAAKAEHLELRATRLIERARDALREVAGVAETRAGRVNVLVRGAMVTRADTTAIASKHETSVDGSAVLLG